MKYSLAALLGIGLIAAPALGWAGDKAPGYDTRLQRQQQRIDASIAKGQLTQGEAKRLNRRQDVIEQRIDRIESDGAVTPRERAAIHRSLNRESRAIRRQAHDRQTVDGSGQDHSQSSQASDARRFVVDRYGRKKTR